MWELVFVSCRGIDRHFNQAPTLKSLKVSLTNCSLGGKSGMLYSKIKKERQKQHAGLAQGILVKFLKVLSTLQQH